jgi:hypothetical protein
MRRLIDAAPEPYKTYYWILAETGVRAARSELFPYRTFCSTRASSGSLRVFGMERFRLSNRLKGIAGVNSRRSWLLTCTNIFATGAPIGSGCSSRPRTEHRGIRMGAETQALSSTRKTGDRALRLSRLPPRQRNGDGPEECADGSSAVAPGPLRRAYDYALHAHR